MHFVHGGKLVRNGQRGNSKPVDDSERVKDNLAPALWLNAQYGDEQRRTYGKSASKRPVKMIPCRIT
jgi:hypothetical protein